MSNGRHSIPRQMSAENDLPQAECRFRYIVCASPRTGSNVITSGLQRTELAGVPLEYLHPDAFGVWGRRVDRPKWTLQSYLKTVERHRTSGNGVFGMKIHFGQLSRVMTAQEQQQRFLRRFDRVIFLSRRNKVAQAVSFHRSNLTNVWKAESDDEVKGARVDEASYACGKIARLVATLVHEEEAWRALFSGAELSCHRLYYEDLVSDYSATMKSVLDFVGIREVPDFVLREPQVKKLGDEINVLWQSRFLKDILGNQSGSADQTER